MRRYIRENWQDFIDPALEGLRDGLLFGALALVLFTLADLLTHSQATLSILRDLRGEFRTAVGPSAPKETTEE